MNLLIFEQVHYYDKYNNILCLKGCPKMSKPCINALKSLNEIFRSVLEGGIEYTPQTDRTISQAGLTVV